MWKQDLAEGEKDCKQTSHERSRFHLYISTIFVKNNTKPLAIITNAGGF
jgi:hypothetical protein